MAGKRDILKSFLVFAIKFVLVVGCLGYIVTTVEWGRFVEYCTEANPWLLVAGMFAQLGALVVIAAMLRFISDNKATFGVSFVALSVANALSLILPAKLGEGAKLYLFTRDTSARAGEVVEWIFWERFSILNVIVLIALVGVGGLLGAKVLVAMALGLVSVWAAILMVWLSPKLCLQKVEQLGFEPVSRILGEFIKTLIARRRLSFFAGITFYSVLCLAFEALVVVISLEAMGIHVNFIQALAIFSAAMLGMIVPASPGSVGVFEAAVAATLCWLGVDETQAVAAAVVMHMFFLVPMIISVLPVAHRVVSLYKVCKRGDCAVGD